MRSYSRHGQDLWALEMLNQKRDGYFVECGAYDGRKASDTLLMEESFGWTGICIEPNGAFRKLIKNRSCICVNDLVGADDTEYPFVEIGRKSSVLGIRDMNYAVVARKDSAVHTVARSLTSILDEHGAPSIIDYFSLDVEGLELTILQNIDFDRYEFRVITVEKNATTDEVVQFLDSNGYRLAKELGRDNGFVVKERIPAQGGV